MKATAKFIVTAVASALLACTALAAEQQPAEPHKAEPHKAESHKAKPSKTGEQLTIKTKSSPPKKKEKDNTGGISDNAK
jgi:outer membrane biogenesis lipoprotein LolB